MGASKRSSNMNFTAGSSMKKSKTKALDPAFGIYDITPRAKKTGQKKHKAHKGSKED